MIYRIAICDDDEDYLEALENKLRKYCEKNSNSATIQSFKNSIMLSEYIERGEMFDAYILDIEMPNCDGIMLAKKINARTKCEFIIFLTAHDGYAVDGYGLGLFRYILKSQLNNKLDNVLGEMFIRLEESQNDKIYTISNQRKYLKLLQREIMYLYKNQKNVNFALRNRIEECERTTIQEVYQKINNPDMFLLDRSTIINLRCIQKIGKDNIIMEDGREIKTTSSHLRELKECISKYWGKRL